MTADEPGEIHVHSSPEQEFEYDKGSSTIQVKPIQAPGAIRSSRTRSRRPSSRSRRSEPSPPARPRPGRRAGPADLPLAGHPRRGGRRRRLVRRPRPRLAEAALRRRDERTTGTGLAGAHRRLGRLSRSPPPGRPARTALPRRRRGPRQGPADQPDLRHLLRLDLGRDGRGLPALRPGLEGDQPVPPDQRWPGPALGRRPGRRPPLLSRAARDVAGVRGPLRVRVDGAGLSPQRRPRPGPALVRDLPGD